MVFIMPIVRKYQISTGWSFALNVILADNIGINFKFYCCNFNILKYGSKPDFRSVFIKTFTTVI